jgi:NAD(P)-dependent dehydrogenase (short-subunit alcohol dehydrogenase family)
LFNLENKKVLLAGGSSGIGFATAKLLDKIGAAVIIGGRDEEKLKQAHQELGSKAKAISFDASDQDQRSSALAQIGPIDHLVIALSGGKGAGLFEKLPPNDLRTGFEAKFWTHFSIAQESLPYLSKTGSITFVSAISARAANPGIAGLAAINSAIEGLVKPLAVELRPRRINAVSPGVVDTPWWNWLAPEMKEETFNRFAQSSPVGRVGQPEDIAQAIVFLIGNTFMTGCVIECDGGLRLVGQQL